MAGTKRPTTPRDEEDFRAETATDDDAGRGEPRDGNAKGSPFPLHSGFRLASALPPAPGVDWIVENVIAAGKLHIGAGEGGIGKTSFYIDVAAKLTNGIPALPGGVARPPMNVLLACLEDGLRDTVVPRLLAAGADLDRVVLLDADEFGLKLPSGLERLSRQVEDAQAGFVLLDPLTALADDGLSISKAEDVRKMLQPLGLLGERAGTTTIVIHHLNKGDEQSARHRVSGSSAVVDVARLVHLVGPHPDDPEERVVAVIKTNLGASKPALRFALADDPTSGAAKVVHLGPCALLGDDLVRRGAPAEPGAVDEAESFMRRVLNEAGGRLETIVLLAKADEAGISAGAISRARKRDGFAAKRSDNKWFVTLCDEPGESQAA